MFSELSLIILIATAVAFVMKLLRQPFIVGYIVTGVIVGPYALNILHSKEDIELFSKLGITILLFIVGLNLNPTVIREIGKTALFTGIGQVVITTIVGYGIATAIGLSSTNALYVAIALTFSSTIIILKLLSDKKDLDNLYGKISIGLLIVQDIIASFILIGLTAIGTSNPDLSYTSVFLVLLLKGGVLSFVLFLANRFFFPKIADFIASSQELLFVFSVAWGMSVAALAAHLGFSVEIGALMAGVTLSTIPFAGEIASRMKPLRDFFILLFFILLGSQMVITTIPTIILPALLLSTFVLVGKPIIMFFVMNLLGYRRKTAFMTALTVAQISEFSLIIITYALAHGLAPDIASLVTLTGLITIAGSSYLIMYSDSLYIKLESFLKLIEIRKTRLGEDTSKAKPHEVVLFGYDRVGLDFVKAIRKLDKRFIVVDFNPKSIRRLVRQEIPHKYGDAEDIEFLEELQLIHTKLVISTIPDYGVNTLLVDYVKRVNPDAIVIVISHNIKEALNLYSLGSSYVVMPHYLGAQYASHLINKHGFHKRGFEAERIRHKDLLLKRSFEL